MKVLCNIRGKEVVGEIVFQESILGESIPFVKTQEGKLFRFGKDCKKIKVVEEDV